MKLLHSATTAVTNCTLLAATLSAKYRTYNNFDPSSSSSSSLESFLDDNGVLVTMCMAYNGQVPYFECHRSKKDNKINASWIQQNKTGFRVVVPPVDIGVPVGLVLKPTSTKVRCTYPLDAGTDQRDNDGCGPLSRDPHYGSKGYDHETWYRKALSRARILAYILAAFPNQTMASIPCATFLDNHDVDNATNVLPYEVMNKTILGDLKKRDDAESWYFISETEWTVNFYSYILGRDVCNRTNSPFPIPNMNDDTAFALYKGRSFWEPEEWSQVVDLTLDVIDKHPNVGIWNELVLDIGGNAKDEGNKDDNNDEKEEEDFGLQDDNFANAVQAVFFVKGSEGHRRESLAYNVAKREAKSLGKPLLYITSPHRVNNQRLDDDVDLFHCANELE